METNGKALATQAESFELALVAGDLSKLTTEERLSYYRNVCDSLGLNPLTKPFSYIQLNGKLVLYALKDAADQLRSLRKVSISIVSRERIEDVYVVTARATLPDGRVDESTGAVTIAGLKGDQLANCLMKAETKAKRRVTLSVCGLGLLDESEIETIPSARQLEAPQESAPPPETVKVAPAEPLTVAEWTAKFEAAMTMQELNALRKQVGEAFNSKNPSDADRANLLALSPPLRIAEKRIREGK